jgi:hypothetical protein
MRRTIQPVKLTEGLRLRIVRGDRKDMRHSDCHGCIMWIAGSVPVGTVGTVKKTQVPGQRPGSEMWALHFDGIEPKPGFIFGLYKLSDQYEIVS